MAMLVTQGGRGPELETVQPTPVATRGLPDQRCIYIYIYIYIYAYTHICEGIIRPPRGSKDCKAVRKMDLISRTVVGRHFFKVTFRTRHLFDYFRSFSDGLI